MFPGRSGTYTSFTINRGLYSLLKPNQLTLYPQCFRPTSIGLLVSHRVTLVPDRKAASSGWLPSANITHGQHRCRRPGQSSHHHPFDVFRRLSSDQGSCLHRRYHVSASQHLASRDGLSQTIPTQCLSSGRAKRRAIISCRTLSDRSTVELCHLRITSNYKKLTGQAGLFLSA